MHSDQTLIQGKQIENKVEDVVKKLTVIQSSAEDSDKAITKLKDNVEKLIQSVNSIESHMKDLYSHLKQDSRESCTTHD